jgi:hypothetical protein
MNVPFGGIGPISQFNKFKINRFLKRRPQMGITSIGSYPPEQAKEMAKRMGELPPPPSYMTVEEI